MGTPQIVEAHDKRKLDTPYEKARNSSNSIGGLVGKSGLGGRESI